MADLDLFNTYQSFAPKLQFNPMHQVNSKNIWENPRKQQL